MHGCTLIGRFRRSVVSGCQIANDDFGEVVHQAELQHVLEVQVIRAEFQGKNGHAPRMSGNGLGCIHAGIQPALAQHVFEPEVSHEGVSHGAGLKRALKTSPPTQPP